MRITGGKARSISINCPKGNWVRPATDRMREAVFSSLGDRVLNAHFLDLFAGAGSYGLEAISRGARSGVFVDANRSATAFIHENLKRVIKSVAEESLKVHSFKVKSQQTEKFLSFYEQETSKVDIVFIDPPYDQVSGSYFKILEKLTPLFEAQAEGWIVLESPESLDKFPEGYELIKTLGKEDTRGLILRWTDGT
ncbi:MAG: RsmD family RNA methyltransferase [Opitutales bacterium]|nr:RsmD family RNA methyltransferase [Opitutales bacterium]